jgi:hypothetical protein
VVVSARGLLPRTAAVIGPPITGSCDPTLIAYVDAPNSVTIRISNNNAAVLVPLNTAVTIDVLQLPLAP